MDTDDFAPRQPSESQVTTLLGIGLALFVIDQAFDSTVAAMLVAAISIYALARWRSSESRTTLIVTIGIMAITVLDFVDAGSIPVLRIR